LLNYLTLPDDWSIELERLNLLAGFAPESRPAYDLLKSVEVGDDPISIVGSAEIWRLRNCPNHRKPKRR